MFKTKSGKIIDIEELTWDKTRSLLKNIAPELVTIIDKIAPSNEYTFFRAKYPFGTKIINKEQTFLPLKDGSTISFNDESLPDELSKKLGYNPTSHTPIGIVLDKNSEFYLSTKDRILPYVVVKPGNIFGTTRVLENINKVNNANLSFFLWELTSGVRSIFFLPKISDKGAHTKLQKQFGLVTEVPKTNKDHWRVFRDLCNKLNPDWHSKFLFFSNKWIESLKLPEFSELYTYFLKENFQSYQFWRNYPSWQIAFDIIEKDKYIVASSYVLNTVKHLFMIATGEALSFKPAIDENSAPIKFLQEIYVNSYGLNGHAPIIMHVDSFNLQGSEPIYYSLNYPTLLQHNEHTFKGKSFIGLVDEVRLSAARYKKGINENSMAKATSLYNASLNVEFDYYHLTPEQYPHLKSSELMPIEDNRFMYNKGNGEFSNHSSFVVACIKISKKSSTD